MISCQIKNFRVFKNSLFNSQLRDIVFICFLVGKLPLLRDPDARTGSFIIHENANHVRAVDVSCALSLSRDGRRARRRSAFFGATR